MKMTTLAIAAALGLALTGEAALAQTDKPMAPPSSDSADRLPHAPATPAVNDGEAYHRAPDSAQDPAEVRTTQALNDEIASRNQLIDSQEQADRAKYEETVTASTQARLAYEEDVRRAQAAQSDWEAEQARWQAERDRWEADVRACEAGDRSRCAPPLPRY